MNVQPTALPDKRAAASHTGLKFFSYFVLLLMGVTILFTFYIMAVNWNQIGV